MNNGTIDLQHNGSTTTLVINRPAKLSTLVPKMPEQLLVHCHTLEIDLEIRVALLTGTSERAFCIGADTYRWTSLSALDIWCSWIHRGHQAFSALAQLPQLVIALLHSLAYGGGPELAATADTRICSAEVQMTLPETGLATASGWSGTQRLAVLLGRPLVKELVFTGESLDAQRALSYGLVNRVVTRRTLYDAGLQLAQRTVQRVPVAVQIAKQVIDAREGTTVASMLEALAGALPTTTEDTHEGSRTLTEKCQSHFSAR